MLLRVHRAEQPRAVQTNTAGSSIHRASLLPGQPFSIPITSLPLKPSLAHSSLYLQAVLTVSCLYLLLHQPCALGSCGTHIHARTRAFTKADELPSEPVHLQSQQSHVKSGFKTLSGNPLCRIPVSGQLGWIFAPGRKQICSRPWVRTYNMGGTPGNCGMSITSYFLKFFRQTQHYLKPRRVFPNHNVTLGRAPSFPLPRFPHPSLLLSPSSRGALHPHKTKPQIP